MNYLITTVALNIVYHHTGTLNVVTVTLNHCKLHILGKATDKWINRKRWCIIDAAARAFPPGSPSTLTTCGVCQVSQHYIWTTNIGFHQLIYLKTSFLDVRNCGTQASKTFSHFQTKAVQFPRKTIFITQIFQKRFHHFIQIIFLPNLMRDLHSSIMTPSFHKEQNMLQQRKN